MATHGTTATATADPRLVHWVWDVIEYRCATTHERAMVVHTGTETVLNCRTCRVHVRLPR